MYYLFRLFSWQLSWWSERSLSTFASLLARLTFWLFPSRLRVVDQNLQIAFGGQISAAVRKEIAYESVYHFALTCLEFLSVRDGSLGRHVSFEKGLEHLDEALSKGQGVYILCIHMGSWEAMAAGLDRMGYPNLVLTKPVRPRGLGRLVHELRRLNGMGEVIRRRKGDGYRGIVAALNANKCVGFVMDQARPNSPRLSFFGRPAKTNTSFAAIYSKRPAPVIPMYARRVGVHRHQLTVLPEVKFAQLDTQAMSLHVNQVVEQMIEACPEQYFWLHNRWKVR
ncbi:MAG: lysophospholipid acyltransferase family protein [Zetaproteobacteria bacterium]|nr:lysophospholipid acyltransferase family protein [Zetaproteobacteria bacterium]